MLGDLIRIVAKELIQLVEEIKLKEGERDLLLVNRKELVV